MGCFRTIMSISFLSISFLYAKDLPVLSLPSGLDLVNSVPDGNSQSTPMKLIIAEEEEVLPSSCVEENEKDNSLSDLVDIASACVCSIPPTSEYLFIYNPTNEKIGPSTSMEKFCDCASRASLTCAPPTSSNRKSVEQKIMEYRSRLVVGEVEGILNNIMSELAGQLLNPSLNEMKLPEDCAISNIFDNIKAISCPPPSPTNLAERKEILMQSKDSFGTSLVTHANRLVYQKLNTDPVFYNEESKKLAGDNYYNDCLPPVKQKEFQLLSARSAAIKISAAYLRDQCNEFKNPIPPTSKTLIAKRRDPSSDNHKRYKDFLDNYYDKLDDEARSMAQIPFLLEASDDGVLALKDICSQTEEASEADIVRLFNMKNKSGPIASQIKKAIDSHYSTAQYCSEILHSLPSSIICQNPMFPTTKEEMDFLDAELGVAPSYQEIYCNNANQSLAGDQRKIEQYLDLNNRSERSIPLDKKISDFNRKFCPLLVDCKEENEEKKCRTKSLNEAFGQMDEMDPMYDEIKSTIKSFSNYSDFMNQGTMCPDIGAYLCKSKASGQEVCCNSTPASSTATTDKDNQPLHGFSPIKKDNSSSDSEVKEKPIAQKRKDWSNGAISTDKSAYHVAEMPTVIKQSAGKQEIPNYKNDKRAAQLFDKDMKGLDKAFNEAEKKMDQVYAENTALRHAAQRDKDALKQSKLMAEKGILENQVNSLQSLNTQSDDHKQQLMNMQRNWQQKMADKDAEIAAMRQNAAAQDKRRQAQLDELERTMAKANKTSVDENAGRIVDQRQQIQSAIQETSRPSASSGSSSSSAPSPVAAPAKSAGPGGAGALGSSSAAVEQVATQPGGNMRPSAASPVNTVGGRELTQPEISKRMNDLQTPAIITVDNIFEKDVSDLKRSIVDQLRREKYLGDKFVLNIPGTEMNLGIPKEKRHPAFKVSLALEWDQRTGTIIGFKITDTTTILKEIERIGGYKEFMQKINDLLLAQK